MNENEQQQIEAILNRELSVAKRLYAERFEQTQSHFVTIGMACSSRILDVAVQHMNDVLRLTIGEMVSKVGAVASSPDAAQRVSATMQLLLGHLSEQLPKAMFASRAHPSKPLETARAHNLFQTVRKEAERDLQIALFSFTGGSIPTVDKAAIGAPVSSQKTGRPLARHWDSLWAHTAAALYNGDLKPQNQAALEHFMAQWLSDNGVNVSSSSIRSRARALWDAISLSE